MKPLHKILFTPNAYSLGINTRNDCQEAVVLIHGLGRRGTSMLSIGYFLKKKGYRVYIYDYPSTRHHIKEHADKFAEFLCKFEKENTDIKKIHIAAHSLGGIIARQALANHTIPAESANPQGKNSTTEDMFLRKIGRVVMLAPPNQGSETANKFSGYWLIPEILKPLRELKNTEDSPIHDMPVPNLEIGIIAGEKDGKVKVYETRLPGEKDHLIVDSYHSFIMNKAEVKAAVANFLSKGKFE